MAVNSHEVGSGPVEATPSAGDTASPEGERVLFVGGPLHGTEVEPLASTVVAVEVTGDEYDRRMTEVTYTGHQVVHPVGERRFARRVMVDTRLTRGRQPDQAAF